MSNLKEGLDFRLPQYRYDVFLDFYEFHLKYRAHPGCVYYLMPYLRDRYGWDNEAALWFAFINGNTQNPVTSLILHRRFPDKGQWLDLVKFYKENYERLEFDTDRRYHKKSMPAAIESYLSLVGPDQWDFYTATAQRGFGVMWRAATSISTFGRLSAYSYLEYVRIMGIDFDCDDLMLADRDGSRSHRNGLCIVSGLDHYDWHKSNPTFDGNYPPELIASLETMGAQILANMKKRAAGKDYERDVSYFTLESALCTYKSWHRPNRRYPNVYNDMLFNRIKKNEAAWPEEDLSVFWEARKHYLPDYLRLEDNPKDLGLNARKQNHYLTTGQVIMMNRDYPYYKNEYNDEYDLS
jgi:hypothetical protein